MAAAKKPKVTSKPKRARGEAAIVEALAPFGFPSAPGPGLGFTKEDDARLAAGYPEMRTLTGEVSPPEDAAARAEAALDAIDPALRQRVPRDLARRFLLGYRVGPLLFVDQNHPPENAARRAERARAVREERPVDEALLRATLDAHGWGMGDTYARWRWPKVLYLYEAFLGTEPVARAVVDHLLAAAADFERWGFAGKDPRRTNATPHAIALALPWLLLRAPPKTAGELRGRLREARDPADASDTEPRAYLALLRWLAEPERPLHPSLDPLAHQLELARGDVTAVGARLDKHAIYTLLFAGRVCWLLGTARLAGKLSVAGHDLPRLVDSVAPIRDAGVVRLMAAIAAQRAGKGAARAWLVEHADYAKPVLEALLRLDDEKETKAASAALALIAEGAAAPAEEAPLDDDALEVEIEAIFAELGDQLRAARTRDAKIAAIREAHEAYTEARAAAGDPIPEAYFTHRFGDFGLGEWAMLAVDAIE